MTGIRVFLFLLYKYLQVKQISAYHGSGLQLAPDLFITGIQVLQSTVKFFVGKANFTFSGNRLQLHVVYNRNPTV